MYSDGHCHLAGSKELAELQQKQRVLSIINCDSPTEYEQNLKLIDQKIQTLSFGIHPWKSEKATIASVNSYLVKAPVIGEIGLDNVWCDIPLATQRPIFEAQLALASTLKKPVVLHTKGCEAEILTYLKKYPNRYLIHWYSAEKLQAEYIELGCYFTIGVDVAKNPAVQQLAKLVPADRLLLETDGLAAVEWALDRVVTFADYLAVLAQSAEQVATIRQTTASKIQELAVNNLRHFLTLE